ncbi:CPBP family glutamic-type intramembrane protease [Palleronia sp. KMU-117]|uniref:CPBP family glutamic-type intramembrane protease n=1 Tax=Palleronia sp. KMU-117 TaxID=3434108 RepID=UPI003D754F68
MRVVPSRRRLAVEFAGLFVVAPVVLAVFLPPSAMFPALFAVTGAGLLLLHRTPGFRWRELLRGADRIGWGRVVALALATAAVGYGVVQATAPASFLALPRRNPQLLLMIAAFYPVLSALPQEIVFRPLFFRRYGALLPQGRVAQILMNAAVFALAHLMYWNWIVAAMTFAGGLAFAWSYRVRGNFPEAVVTHSIAGVILFALGLGVFFYSGNVERPF